MATPVNFNRPAAERIARVVRVVEFGNRDSTGPSLDRPWYGGAGAKKVFRMCTFTGTWDKNTFKTVTFRNQTTTPNTASAINLFVAISGSTATATLKNCAIARDGTAWYLIAAECQA